MPTTVGTSLLSIDIKYSNVQIDVDKLWFPELFFQFPNTLCGFYNQDTNATLCILLVNVTKDFIITMLISGAMFYCVITRSSMPYGYDDA